MDTYVTECQWIQVNNTIVPVIPRISSDGQLVQCVPLSVIQYGAGLLQGVSVKTLQCTPGECCRLVELCNKAGFDFQFPLSTQLILLKQLMFLYRYTIRIVPLPGDYPFMYAEQVPEEAADQALSPASPPISECTSEPADLSLHNSDHVPDQDLPLDLSNKADQQDDTDINIDAIVSEINRCKQDTMHLQQNSSSKIMYGKQIQCMTKDNKEYVELSDLYRVFFQNTSFTVFKTIIKAIGTPLHDLPVNSQTSIWTTDNNFVKKFMLFEDVSVLLYQTKTILGRKETHKYGRQNAWTDFSQRSNTDRNSWSSQTRVAKNMLSATKTRATEESNIELSTIRDMDNSSDSGILSINGQPNRDKGDPQTNDSGGSLLVPNLKKRKRLLETVTKLHRKIIKVD